MLRQLDDIDGRVRALTPAEDADVPAQSTVASDEGFRTVRVDVAEMDAVLDGVAETHTLLDRTSRRRAGDGAYTASGGYAPGAARAARRERDRRQPRGDADRIVSIAEEFRRCFGALERSLGSAMDQMDRELRQLRDATEQFRLVSAGTLFTALERTARDTAQALSKHVLFEGKGGEIRLDSHVLGTVQGALVQLVRNAVAHGIETARERRAPASRRPAALASMSSDAAAVSCSTAATTGAAWTSTPYGASR